MRVSIYGRKLQVCLFVLFLVCTSAVFAKQSFFDRVVVIGTSLSDSGNAFVLINNPTEFGFDQCQLGTPLNVPPYDQMDKLYLSADLFYELLVPDGVYARGGHHDTNGATWIEQFARGQGLSGTVRPALRNPGTEASNYAVGGARARMVPQDPKDDPLYDVISCRFNLSDQVQAYLKDFQIDVSSPISSNTLIVIEMGGNDVRDALSTQNPVLIGAAVSNIYQAIQTLYDVGARKFLLMNVPNIGRTPTVRLLDSLLTPPPTPPDDTIAYNANLLSMGFDGALAQLQRKLNSLQGMDIRMLDLYGLLEEIVWDKENNASKKFGITNVSDACITPNVPPYTCQSPDTYLFWDGIHPTKAVHGIMAQRAAKVLQ